MIECYRCGVSGNVNEFFDAISSKDVVKLCEKCASNTDLPIINRPTKFQLKTAETPYSVYDRLSRMAGLNPTEHREKFSDFKQASRVESKKQESSLRELIDKNYEAKKDVFKPVPREDLIDNFHWIVLRGRRMKKLTQEQLAKEIGVPISSIVDMERAFVPEEGDELIHKLESFLGIKIKKSSFAAVDKEIKEKKRSQFIQDPKFDQSSIKDLTINDLREMKKGFVSHDIISNEAKGSEISQEGLILDEDVEIFDERNN